MVTVALYIMPSVKLAPLNRHSVTEFDGVSVQYLSISVRSWEMLVEQAEECSSDAVLDTAAIRRVEPYYFAVPSSLSLSWWLLILEAARMITRAEGFLISTFSFVELLGIGR